jgi:hypothetical protein
MLVSLRKYLALLCGLLLAAPAVVDAEASVHGEYEVKAAFLYNFAKFIDWPPLDDAQFTVCVFGRDPFGRALDPIEGKTVGGKTVAVRRLERAAAMDLKTCRILFIATSEEAQVAHILELSRGSPMLTVGDTDGFARQGVMINFYLEQEKVRFEINPRAAAEVGIRPSAKLLQLGRIVDTAKN